MSKEYLEALKTIGDLDYIDEYDCRDGSLKRHFNEEFTIVEKALQRLESIDNSKPSEALERIKTKIIIETEIRVNKEVGVVNPYYNDYLIIKQALLKSQEQEKVLKIIKRVYTDLCFILSFDTFEEYDRTCDLISVQANLKRVNKEEFDLLKRWAND